MGDPVVQSSRHLRSLLCAEAVHSKGGQQQGVMLLGGADGRSCGAVRPAPHPVPAVQAQVLLPPR